MPGIALERDLPTPAIATDEITDEDRARRAAANANFSPNLILDANADDDRSGSTRGRGGITQNFVYHLNADHAGANHIEHEEDSDADIPGLRRGDPDSSDDEDDDYEPSDQEDEDLVEDVEPAAPAAPVEPIVDDPPARTTRSGRTTGIRDSSLDAEESVMKEMTQMHDLQAFFPRDAKTMTREERTMALSSLIFLKEKANGDIKARACINGAPQREYIKKEDAASPTAATDSVMIVGAVSAFENRNVVTLDLPGAFLQTKTDELVFMVLRGELCELMVRVNPKIYRRYVTSDKNGKPIMYVQLYKSVYGLLRSALLFYRRLRKELEDFGFVVNPYDPCVANKTTADGHQQTVLWHVDDLHVSHVDKNENERLVAYLRRIYGDKMTINRGKEHRYLGMDFDYSRPGVLKMSMIKYIREVLDDFPELITKTSRTPHTDNLFKVRPEDEADFLSEDQAQLFHRTVAQLLFLSGRARRDIQTAVAFLTTRVKRPDNDDWGKVKRVLQYLKGTINMPLNLTIDNLQFTKWQVDSSHGTHDDCKGHTGAGMTLGKGAISSFSRKQKINTRSSTETEVVGVDDAMPSVLWSLYFLQAQGYGTEKAIIYQDNKSAILLEVNGKFSSSKRTKHIKMKYFFVKDKVEDGEVEIRHEPGENMWVDMLSKPSQGIRFETDRSALQNIPIQWVDDLPAPVHETGVLKKKPRYSPLIGD
eukprot:scaffold21075_cov96-Cyclotella_meneghiniana.AAC.1